MRIAICDDEQPILNYVVGLVRKEFNRYTTQITYEGFWEPDQCVISAKRKPFDVAFLDLNMPINGMILAKQLIETNSDICIIFITSQEEQVFESFQVGAKRFIRKYKLEDELPEAIRFVWEDYVGKAKRIEISVDHEKCFVRVDEIFYIESFKNYLILHLYNEEIKTKRGLADIEAELPENFIRCHKSFVINTEHIAKLSGMSILLENEDFVPVGRQKLETVKNAILKKARTWL